MAAGGGLQPVPAVALAVGLEVAFAHAAGEHVGVQQRQFVQHLRLAPAGGQPFVDAAKDVHRLRVEVVVVLDRQHRRRLRQAAQLGARQAPLVEPGVRLAQLARACVGMRAGKAFGRLPLLGAEQRMAQLVRQRSIARVRVRLRHGRHVEADQAGHAVGAGEGGIDPLDAPAAFGKASQLIGHGRRALHGVELGFGKARIAQRRQRQAAMGAEEGVAQGGGQAHRASMPRIRARRRGAQHAVGCPPIIGFAPDRL